VSVTQLGVRLRVLIPDSVADPLEIVDRALAARGIDAGSNIDTPSLEDVFVAVTLKPGARAA
jgi:ABC-2 type transport system ATP-binding protein